MNTTIESLQALYIKLGGNLTDTYEGIAGGIPVGEMSLIPDLIAAVTEKVSSGGDSGKASAFASLLALSNELSITSGYDQGAYYFVDIRINEQKTRGGMDEITAEELTTQIDSIIASINPESQMTATQKTAKWMYYIFGPGAGMSWKTDILIPFVQLETGSLDEMYIGLGAILEENPGGWSRRISTRDLLEYVTNSSLGTTLQNYVSKGSSDVPFVIEGEAVADSSTHAFNTITTDTTFADAFMSNDGSVRFIKVVVYTESGDERTVYKVLTLPLDVELLEGTYSVSASYYDGTGMVYFSDTGVGADTIELAAAP